MINVVSGLKARKKTRQSVAHTELMMLLGKLYLKSPKICAESPPSLDVWGYGEIDYGESGRTARRMGRDLLRC